MGNTLQGGRSKADSLKKRKKKKKKRKKKMADMDIKNLLARVRSSSGADVKVSPTTHAKLVAIFDPHKKGIMGSGVRDALRPRIEEAVPDAELNGMNKTEFAN